MRKLFALLATSLAVISLGWSQTPLEKSAGKQDKSADKADRTPKPGSKSPDQTPGKGLELGKASDADKKLDEAIAKIEALATYQAGIRQTTEMLGYKFTSEGRCAFGPDYRMLYELTVHMTDRETKGTLLEVCDGRRHIRSQKILDTHDVIELNVEAIREIIEKPVFKKEARDELVRELGFSGIVPLLRGLRNTQRFDTIEEDTLGDAPVFILKGTWRDEVLNPTGSGARGQKPTITQMPAHIPSKTTLWLGKEDGWPHRMLLESAKKGATPPTVITLEFLNPQIGGELPASLFAIELPADVKSHDQTPDYKRMLTALLQKFEQDQKQEKAPKSGGGDANDGAGAESSGGDAKPRGLDLPSSKSKAPSQSKD